MEEQQQEIERAVVNIGEYRLRKEYRHLSVESSKWFKLTTDQRKSKMDMLMEAPLVLDLPSTSHSRASIPCPLEQCTDSLSPQIFSLGKGKAAF